DQELRLSEEARIQEEEEADELYRDININQGRGLQVSKNVEDSHVTLTPVQPDGPQESSSVSSRCTNPTNNNSKHNSLPTFNSAFRFDERLRLLETTFSEYRQTNPFVDDVSAIPGIVHQYMTQQMTEAVREVVQIQTDRLQDSLQRENDEFLRNIDENMKKIIKGQVKNQVKEQVSRILPRIEDEDERMMIRKDPPLDKTGGLKDKKKEVSMHQLALHMKQQPGVQADLPHGLNLDNCLPVSLLLQRNLCRLPVRWRNPHIWCLKQVPTINQLFKHLTAQGDAQSWISDLARQTDARSSFNKLLDTPIDFSNFIMNRLNVDTLTPELLVGPTYELMRGSCNSLTELEYHLEEVYKATTDQLDWVNPEGQQYPHDLLQPLPLIPDNRGRWVIPFEHFINNDLEYLWGGEFKRLRLQDIEDMLLLLVQWNLSNLTVKERFAFNVSLRLFTRSTVIKRRVEDLQLGVKSYQKKLNLTKPDTY
nr:hypothetical protein [Tanacetum cinerariifolium]